MDRTNKAALACALVIGVATSAIGRQTDTPTPGATPTGVPTPTQKGTTTGYPSLPDSAINADFSRNIGTFATVEAAIAAAKAAAPPAGAYCVATVASETLAIDAEGIVYHLGWMTGSGSGQRPPKNPGGQ